MPNSSPASTAPMQIIAYLKRHTSLTREQFYTHWETKHAPIVAPLLKKYGIIRYQQIRASGQIHSNRNGNDGNGGELVEFDGIALTLVQDMGDLAKLLEDEYFKDVVEKDEDVFLDRDAPGKGVVALFFGACVSVIDDAKAET